MKRVGLTGGIASGKSTVAELLRAKHVPVVDADQVSREVVAPGQPALAQIAARFGAAVLNPDGSLDRKALGARVVADAEARRALEAITHPAIRAAVSAVLDRWEAAGYPVAVVEASLMVETGSWRAYDAVLVVAASPETQRLRLQAREGYDAATAERWLAAQLPLEEKLKVATAVIWNDAHPDRLPAALDLAWGAICQKLGIPEAS